MSRPGREGGALKAERTAQARLGTAEGLGGQKESHSLAGMGQWAEARPPRHQAYGHVKIVGLGPVSHRKQRGLTLGNSELRSISEA